MCTGGSSGTPSLAPSTVTAAQARQRPDSGMSCRKAMGHARTSGALTPLSGFFKLNCVTQQQQQWRPDGSHTRFTCCCMQAAPRAKQTHTLKRRALAMSVSHMHKLLSQHWMLKLHPQGASPASLATVSPLNPCQPQPCPVTRNTKACNHWESTGGYCTAATAQQDT
jgi:hypothetical protein